ncbi:MAG: polyprenyl synthetase family protein [Negativicutes bacterium]|nr:polyprenyl synthetase family protein [Negativicutes bacterium]
MTRIDQYREKRAAMIDRYLEQAVPAEGAYPPQIFEAMRYSLFAGGKRLRGILVMSAADACGSDGEKFLPAAAGIEMLHCSALIHDDLPCIDNDAYRRGKPTNHRVYGEGLALLAGNALHSLGFYTILSQQGVDSQIVIKVARETAEMIGPAGMAGGQALDITCRDSKVDDKALDFMCRHKKGALFRAAICAGGALAGAKDRYVDALGRFAEHYGTAFQITDDILDVSGTVERTGKSVGSDIRHNKTTFVSRHTLDGARKLARQEVDRALEALRQFGPEADMLRELAEFLLVRDY